MKYRYFFLSLLIICGLTGLTGQETSETKTIEEIYLQSAIRKQIIRTEAQSEDRDMKLIALKDIEEMISEGMISPDDEEMIDIVEVLAKEGNDYVVFEGRTIVNNFPVVRKEACRMLGEIGGDYARTKLISVLNNEKEPMVLSEAVVALSKVGVDDDGVVISRLAGIMQNQRALTQDNNFAIASLIAIENIASDNNGISDPAIIAELAYMADARSGYLTVVRVRALNLLKDLQNY